MARLSGSLAQLAFCQPHCVCPNYASGASRLLLGLLTASQLLFWAKQANFVHLLSTGPLMMMVLRYYSHGVRGTQQGPHLLSFTPSAPSAPLRRLRRRSGAFGAGFFLFFSSFFFFFRLCEHQKTAPFLRQKALVEGRRATPRLASRRAAPRECRAPGRRRRPRPVAAATQPLVPDRRWAQGCFRRCPCYSSEGNSCRRRTPRR